MRKIILFCVFLSTAIVRSQDAARPASPVPAPAQWEYTVLTLSKFEEEKERLEKLGAEGWELVSVVSVVHSTLSNRDRGVQGVLAPHLRYYFKRAKTK